MFALC
jgi:hypothetical protein